MQRQIYITYAYIVDANGNWSDLQGYPKSRDSKTTDMGNDLNKTWARANKDNSDAWSKINEVDTRQIGTVFTVDATGFPVIPAKTRGALADVEAD